MTNIYLENRLVLEDTENKTMVAPIELEYYLVESEFSSLDGPAGIKIYGIGIIKKTNDKHSEGEMIVDFSSSIHQTREVLGKLAGNSVTPVALKSILEDMIDI